MTTARLGRISYVIAALMLPLSAANGQKTQKDVPLRMTLHETAVLMSLDGTAVNGANPVASAVVGDGNDVYTNGTTAGVTIKYSSGTYDAVLNLLIGKRKLTWIIPAPIPGSNTGAQTPPPGTYAGNGVLNVVDILCQGCTPGSFGPGKPFVTRAVMGLNSMFNGDDYGLRFAPIANISSLPVSPWLENYAIDPSWETPNITSLVLVQPQPYNCSQGSYPSWLVRGTLVNSTSQPSYVALATMVDKTKVPPINTGQFSMPFEVLVEALECFNPGY